MKAMPASISLCPIGKPQSVAPHSIGFSMASVTLAPFVPSDSVPTHRANAAGGCRAPLPCSWQGPNRLAPDTTVIATPVDANDAAMRASGDLFCEFGPTAIAFRGQVADAHVHIWR